MLRVYTHDEASFTDFLLMIERLANPWMLRAVFDVVLEASLVCFDCMGDYLSSAD